MATTQGSPSLSNGIFLRDTEIEAKSHLDSYHLRHMLAGADSQPDNMGMIELWAMKQKINIPIYSLANANMTEADYVKDLNGRFSWQIPVQNDLPFAVEDIDPSNTTKGLDGQTFQIKLSRREFGKTDIITYDKYSGVELYIVPTADIINAGDHTIYTVQLVNNDNVQYLDNKFLASGIKYFRVGSARGEYGQEFADMRTRAGFREFYNMLPTGEANANYSISSRADLIAKKGLTQDGKRIPVTQLWTNTDKNLDPSINTIESMRTVMGDEYVKKAIAGGDMTMNYITKLEASHVNKVALDIENYLMWGKGGRIRQDGPDDIRMSVGLWKQLDSSYKRIYNKNSFSLALFRNELYSYYNGKEESQEADPQRVLEVWTGLAGSQMVNTLIAKEAAGLGWLVNADRSGVNAVYGQGMNLGFGFYFQEIIIPFFAKLRFRLNPAFDPYNQNTIENPMIDGFPLSSYSFIIHDINETKDNIRLKKAQWDPGFRWWYSNGTMDYMGKTSGFASSDRKNGYEVFMSQAYPMLWVVDPSKLLKIVMKNNLTGGSL